MLEPCLNLVEAQKYLGVSKHTIRKLAREGKLPARKVGRDWRFDPEALQLYVFGDGETTEAMICPLEEIPTESISETSLSTEEELGELLRLRIKS